MIAARFGIPLLFGEATKPGGLVNRTIVSDDFSDSSGSWPTINTGTTSAEVSGGTYNIKLQNPKDELEPIQYLPEGRWGSMSVEASAESVGSARTAFGIGCVMSTDTTSGQEMTSGTSYLFVLIPSNGKYLILRADGGGAQPVALKQGNLPSGVGSGVGPTQLKATCSTSGGSSTSLAFFADSKQIATTTDANGPGSFNGIELAALAVDAPAEVRFDDAVMKRI